MDVSRFNKCHLIKMHKTRNYLDGGYTLKYAIKFTIPNKIILELLDEHFGEGMYASLLERWEQKLSTGESEFFYIYLSINEYDEVSYEGWDTSECESMKMYRNFPFFDVQCNSLPLE